ncbi:hypothetical protein CCH79_00016356 [Gambusia affinis]|uniref:Uncharacterized protein n=1 Tax=Gambusia affinis TaxID=33528 RepID=A0A315VZI4_GAMAF|nr:hypothetical protein CCH79_00016356 [Gambusia affinis]
MIIWRIQTGPGTKVELFRTNSTHYVRGKKKFSPKNTIPTVKVLDASARHTPSRYGAGKPSFPITTTCMAVYFHSIVDKQNIWVVRQQAQIKEHGKNFWRSTIDT